MITPHQIYTLVDYPRKQLLANGDCQFTLINFYPIEECGTIWEPIDYLNSLIDNVHNIDLNEHKFTILEDGPKFIITFINE